jgi:NAD-dependent DNA ligase (contains BRCT domain type II)
MTDKPVKELTENQAATEAADLRPQLIAWGKAYYDADAPSVEDDVYDRVYARLVALETAFPNIVTPESPTQHVGGTTRGDLPKVNHDIPMLSLGDVFSIDELKEFDARLRENVDEADRDFDYNCELKIDGLAINLHYENGSSSRARPGATGESGKTSPPTSRRCRRFPRS